MILIVLLYALFASSFAISKTMLQYASPIFLVGIRMFIGGSILLFYHGVYCGKTLRLKKEDIKYFAIMSIFGVYLSYTMRYTALTHLPSTKAYFLYKFAPFFAALFSYISFNEKLNRNQWLGLIIGFIGLIPILLQKSPLEDIMGSFFFISVPEILVLTSVAMHCYSKIAMRQLVRDKKHPVALVNGIAMTIGGLLALITSVITETGKPISEPLPFIGLLALAILVSNIICYNLYAHLLKKYTTTLVSLTGFSSIFFAAFYGWILFGETITWHYFASGIIIFVGLYLFYIEESKKYLMLNETMIPTIKLVKDKK